MKLAIFKRLKGDELKMVDESSHPQFSAFVFMKIEQIEKRLLRLQWQLLALTFFCALYSGLTFLFTLARDLG